MSDLIVHTKSRIAGKNADVYIYPNRIEWALAPKSTGTNITAIFVAFFTFFISLIWFRPSFKVQATNTIPASKVSSVQTKKDGPVNTLVTVVTSGANIEFRTSHDRAQAIKDTLSNLVS